MKLQAEVSMKRKVIYVDITTVEFTPEEEKMFDQYGEPNVKFSKTYEESYLVNIDSSIRRTFKHRVVFDGSVDINSARLAYTTFIEDLRLELENIMIKYTEDVQPLMNEGKTLYDINYKLS